MWSVVAERGFLMGLPQRRQSLLLHLSLLHEKSAGKTIHGQDWASVMECANAQAYVMPPHLSFSRGDRSVHQELAPHLDEDDEMVRIDPYGHTNEMHLMQWLTEIFIPHAKGGDDLMPPTMRTQLLLIEGWHIMVPFDFFVTCPEQNIIPLCPPGIASQNVQPLDVGLFPSVLREYTSRMYSTQPSFPLTTLTREEFIEHYEASRLDMGGPSLLVGWMATGLRPFS
ncbi:hypothetical protein BO70DRAFT_129993 [Aspergillus heteromorphus CBS 117.55]|uniref:DDE-1 domain-containing protein n=1 Tax=Aspergillus heteromorphus CBS 117.55 TaxID=1448321 RepID=A0A317WUU6_9EURO|nr:uncharacterized protein BO70DRAFT_129993 [Aspergillus heteromorphus CBS 117.55]PWY89855.1 hypothetical protein BO70DRAFT_129993 [Aspergillus heteromorphus CBS 117.55]